MKRRLLTRLWGAVFCLVASAAHGFAQGRGGAPGGRVEQSLTLPTQPYVVIDASGASITHPVCAVAIDKDGKAAFATATSDGAAGEIVSTKTFVAGVVADAGHFSTVFSPDQGHTWKYLDYRYLRPNGDWLGSIEKLAFIGGADEAGNDILPSLDDPTINREHLEDYFTQFTGGFLVSNGQLSELSSFPYVDAPDNVYPHNYYKHRQMGDFLAGSDAGFAIWSTYSELHAPGQPVFNAGTYTHAGFYNGLGRVAEIKGQDHAFFFDPQTPIGVPNVTGPPLAITFLREAIVSQDGGYSNFRELNDAGAMISGWGGQWWNGQQILSTNLPSNETVFWGLTNENRMVGELNGDPAKGFLWESGTHAPLSDLLIGTGWEHQITHIVPLLISNEHPLDHVYRMVTAVQNAGKDELVLWKNVQPPPPPGQAELPARRWHLAQMRFPAGVSILWQLLEVINSSGVIAAVGNPGPTSATAGDNHALLLVPLELNDMQSPDKPKAIQPLPDRDPGESDNHYLQRPLPEGCIAYIDPHPNGAAAPQMPHLVAKLPGAPQGINVRWRLEVEYKRGNGYRDYYVQDFTRPEDKVLIPTGQGDDPTTGASGTPVFTAEMDANADWRIFETPDWLNKISQRGFFGGTAKLYLWLPGQNPTPPTEPLMTFRIGGKNPDPQSARAFIDSQAGQPFWYAYAIARHETYGRVRENGAIRFYNQFYTDYKGAPIGDASVDMGWAAWAKGWPLYNLDRDRRNDGSRYQNGAGGYGTYQLTWGPKQPSDHQGTGSNGFLPRRMIWNWQDNVKGAITELQGKVTAAQRLQTTLHSAFPQWPNLPNEGRLTGLEAIVVTFYNGTAGLPSINSNGARTPWLGISRSGTRIWKFYQNSQNYVGSVNARINNKLP